MILYLAGPMRGFPEFNYPAFHAAAARLREIGHTVFNPAENHNGDTSLPWSDYMRTDIKLLANADAIAVLPGWTRSQGARLEVHIARELGMAVLDAEDLQMVPPFVPGVCQEAHELIHGARVQDYGHPREDFTRTAAIWSAILGCPVSAEQVALCMIGLKVSRHCHRPKRDNLVDICGYAGTIERLGEVMSGGLATD